MANVLNRTTKKYLKSVNTPDYPVLDWIINPDMSAVSNQLSKYWTITGDDVSLMSQAERDAVDVIETQEQLSKTVDNEKVRIDEDISITAITSVFVEKINDLNTEVGIATVTLDTVKAEISTKIDEVLD